MTKPIPKQVRVKLDGEPYRELYRQILQRDGWRCQICGSMKHLQVHHIKFRSHCGADSEDNLITLCHDCHSRAHWRRPFPA